jgi:hypothetical protein
MKNSLRALVGALTIVAALPALAGPDWQLIEQARKAKTNQAEHRREANQAASAPRAGEDGRSPLMLALDHGPRAQSTPYLNERLRARHEALFREAVR